MSNLIKWSYHWLHVFKCPETRGKSEAWFCPCYQSLKLACRIIVVQGRSINSILWESGGETDHSLKFYSIVLFQTAVIYYMDQSNSLWLIPQISLLFPSNPVFPNVPNYLYLKINPIKTFFCLKNSFCFDVLTIMNNSAAINIEVHISLQTNVFKIFRYIPIRGVAGSYE